MSRYLLALAAVILAAGLATAEELVTASPADLLAPPAPEGERFYCVAEYLLWSYQQPRLDVPLATANVFGGVPVVGGAFTTVLAGGGERADYDLASGARVTAGVWLDRKHGLGLEASGFILAEQDYQRTVFTPAGGSLGRPFLDLLARGESARLISFPGAFAGSLTVSTSTAFGGADAGGVWRAWCGDMLTVDVTGGYRYLSLAERLTVADTSAVLGGGVAALNGAAVRPGAMVVVADDFRAQNDYQGGYVGGRVRLDWKPCFVAVGGRVGIGNVRQELTATGSTTVIGGPTAGSAAGGLLAVGPALGTTVRNMTAVVPEFDFKLGVKFARWADVFVGYGFIYMSEVARPGETLDRGVNTTFVPSSPNFGVPFGPARPVPAVNSADFFAHGLNLGLTLTY